MVPLPETGSDVHLLGVDPFARVAFWQEAECTRSRTCDSSCALAFSVLRRSKVVQVIVVTIIEVKRAVTMPEQGDAIDKA